MILVESDAVVAYDLYAVSTVTRLLPLDLTTT